MADNPKVRLIVSEDKEPTIKVRPGMKIEMVEVSAEDSEGASQEMVLSTLCGYGSTYCVAVIQTN